MIMSLKAIEGNGKENFKNHFHHSIMMNIKALMIINE